MTAEATYVYGMDAPVSTPPNRVVSLVPSITESLFDLNLGRRLVGISDQCSRPEEKVRYLRRIGSPQQALVADIIALSPELVIANADENRAEDIHALQAAGVPVWVTQPRTVADVFNLLWNIMHLFDETEMVPRIRLMEQTMDWVWRMSEQRLETQPCRVFVALGDEPLRTIVAGRYAQDVLRVCGAIPVLTDGQALDWPSVLKAVDMVLLPDDAPNVLSSMRQAMTQTGLLRPFALIEGNWLTWTGTRLAYALDRLPVLLCPAGV